MATALQFWLSGPAKTARCRLLLGRREDALRRMDARLMTNLLLALGGEAGRSIRASARLICIDAKERSKFR
jgi:hypothetical protein